MDIGNLLFNMNGKISRSEWWLGQILICVFACVLGFIFHWSIPREITMHIFSIHNVTIGMLVGVAYFWSHLSLNAKRWRDIGKSGWWTITNYIPIIGFLISFFILGFFKSKDA